MYMVNTCEIKHYILRYTLYNIYTVKDVKNSNSDTCKQYEYRSYLPCSVLLTFQLQIERNHENLIIDRYTGKSMVYFITMV